MDDPYLSSDESLILSTHNILIDGVSLDLMLTSRRLILIDNSVTPFLLRSIPLESIITVFAGTDVKGDPIFTVSHMDPSGTGAPLPVDFIFTRQKGGQRVNECNEWAATLSNYASGVRNEALSSGTLPYDPVKVIQPRMSATYRIETFSPRRPVIEEYPAKEEPVPLPVLPKTTSDNEVTAGTGEHAPLESAEMVERYDISRFPPAEPEEVETPYAQTPVLSPRGTPEGVEENAAIADAPVTWAGAVRTVTPSLPLLPPTLALEAIPVIMTADVEPPAGADQIHLAPEEPVNVIVADEKNVVSDVAQAWADAVRRVTTPLPVTNEVSVYETSPAADMYDNDPTTDSDPISTTPEGPLPERKDDIIPVNSMITELPAGQSASKTAPVPAESSPDAPSPRKIAYPLMPIAAIVVILAVVLGAAVIGSFPPPETRVISPPVVVTDVTIQPVSTPFPAPIPVDGVWVRIEYPGTFIGEVGNSELMHPTSGSGVQLYKILWSDRLVQVFAQKQETNGDMLTIEVYHNGTLLKRSSTRVPMGSVKILIDPITGQPPGIRHGDIP